jgi:outer membrane scaffolding protein for murein synthesis (MipA/OmpV family)
MKRAFLAAVLVSAMVMAVSSQENRMWLGGTISLSGQDNGQKQSTTTILPELGYYLPESAWAIGIRAGLTTERTVVQDNTRRVNTTTVAPFARYNFVDSDGFRLFGQAELPLQFFGGKHYDGSSMDSSNSIGFRVRPGLTYTMSEKWGFNMLMPTVFDFVHNSDAGSSYSFGINDGYTIQGYLLSTALGFVYNF